MPASRSWCASPRGIPVLDMLQGARGAGRLRRAPWSVLELPGRDHAGRCKIGIMPGAIHKRQDRHRVAFRHPDLRGGIPDHRQGLGQSTCVGIGGDPIHG